MNIKNGLVFLVLLTSCSQVSIDNNSGQEVNKKPPKVTAETGSVPEPEQKASAKVTETLEKESQPTMIQRIIAYEKRRTLAEAEQKNRQKHSRSKKTASVPEQTENIRQKQIGRAIKELDGLKNTTAFSKQNASVVSIDEQGRLIVNGQPFFVIGLYAVPPKHLGEAKRLGFNSVHTYQGEGVKDKFNIKRTAKMLKYLEAANNKGLMVWVGLPRYEINQQYLSVISKRIDLLKNSPALISWYLYDEPDCGDVSVHKIDNVAELLRKQDPNHPKILVLCGIGKKSQSYFSIPDIVGTDYYPVGRAPISKVTHRIETTRFALKNSKPIWNVVQMHGKGKGGRGYGLKEPNYKELRNMTYQSIVAGSTGILFFSYTGSQFKLFKSPEGLRNVKKVTNELHELAPILLSDKAGSYGISVRRNPYVKTRFFKYQQKTYLIVVNLARDQVKINITTKKQFNDIVSVMFEERDIKIENNALVEVIEPLGVRIYQFDE